VARANPDVPSGVVVVDKPGQITSHGVVARVRRLAGTRKVGHAGTLDPMATGVLVLGVNRATRLLGHLMLTEKGYDATIRLGVSTVTDDAEGETTAVAPALHVDPARIRRALLAFTGEIDQVPTAVSAIKVDGQRAYARVRAGEDVELKARTVTISRLDVLDVRAVPDVAEGCVDVDVSMRCSAGTYVRAVARDLGAVLGTGGHLTALRRTAVGPFTLDAASTLEQLEEDYHQLPIAEVARAVFPAVELTADEAAAVRVGRGTDRVLDGTGEHALFAPDGTFLALHTARPGGGTSASAVFV